MPSMRVCARHRTLYPTGQHCPNCGDPEQTRRSANNVRLGRNTRHWKRIRRIALVTADGHCPRCRTAEREHDPGSKLTVDLIGGGDHSKATLDRVRVLCRRCHGELDGGAI